MLVEAAGVEPASEKVCPGKLSCVSASRFSEISPSRTGKKRANSSLIDLGLGLQAEALQPILLNDGN